MIIIQLPNSISELIKKTHGLSDVAELLPLPQKAVDDGSIPNTTNCGPLLPPVLISFKVIDPHRQPFNFLIIL